MGGSELPLLTFADAAAFLQWLEANGETSPGVWLRFAKRGAPGTSLGKTEAIDCALAYGWVDGQLGRLDEHFFKTRFTPRRPGSAWSQLNRERVETMERAGQMRPPGRAQVEEAKADGRWAAAYAGQGKSAPDADLIEALNAAPSARRLFDGLDAANRYAVLYRVHQAKTPEKRAAKIAEMVEMLNRGETIHPRRARRGGGG